MKNYLEVVCNLPTYKQSLGVEFLFNCQYNYNQRPKDTFSINDTKEVSTGHNSTTKILLDLGFIHGSSFQNNKLKQAWLNWCRLQKLNG